MKTYITVYFGTVLLAMLLVPIVSRLAKRHRLVDAPGPRKVHRMPVPRIGGIAFAVATLALVVPLFFVNNEIGQSLREARGEFITLLVAAAFIFAVGLVDDLRSLSGYVKLLCLVVASLAICASGAALRSFSVGTWFEIGTGWAAWPLTVLWITMITVCMNFIDGLDGLAAGIAVIVCGAVAFMAFLTGQAAMAVLMLALLGSVTGFLFFNFYPAKIFMGDCGSMFLGFMIGAGSVVCQTKTHTLVGLAVPLLAMGVPILDTGFAFIRRRVLERRSVFSADRKHLHHRLLDLGLHQRTVVITIYAVTAISASIGVFMVTADSGWSVGLLAVGLLGLLSLFACLNGGRYCEMIMVLKRNRAIAYEAKAVRRNFEEAQLRMTNATSLRKWWETLCSMGDQMHFQTMELRKRKNGQYESTCVWKAAEGKFTSDNGANVRLPIRGKGTAEWEIKVRIWVNGCLEIGGRQAALLARLMDEFPPPEQETEFEVSAETRIRDANSRSEHSEELGRDKLNHQDAGKLATYTHTG